MLGEVACIAPSGTFDPKVNAPRPYVGLEHLDSDTRSIGRLGSSETTGSLKTKFQRGDVLFGKLRPYLRKVALAEIDGVCTTEILVLRPRDSRVTPEFLYYLAASRNTIAHAVNQSAGTRMPRISPRDLLRAPVPLPPIEEQRRIADLLAVVDVARQAHARKREASWELLLRMTDVLLTSPTWPIRRLNEVAGIGGGITKGRRSAGARPVPYLRVANVQHGRLDLSDVREIEAADAEIEKHSLVPGDVLLLEGGNKEDVGRGWLWSGEVHLCLHQNHLHRARPILDVIEPRFLAYSICRAEARAYCLVNAKQTSNLATINRTQISGLPIRLPDTAEQRRVVGLLDAVRLDYEATTAISDYLGRLRETLLSALLSAEHVIPESYDRVLAEKVAEAEFAPVMV